MASDDEEFSSRQANLEEYRRIRKEQDEEYERSLQADRLKVFLYVCPEKVVYIISMTSLSQEEEKENKKVGHSTYNSHKPACQYCETINFRNWTRSEYS